MSRVTLGNRGTVRCVACGQIVTLRGVPGAGYPRTTETVNC